MLGTLAPLIVILGTATPGGGFPVYGAAVAETINEIDPSLAVQPRNTKGSTENVPLLEAGQLDIALVQGEVVHETLTGVGRPPADLKILFAMYSTPGMFVVRADSPYRATADLRGKPVAFGLRARDPRPLRPRRPRPRSGARLPGRLSRPRGRRARDGARRARRRALGRRARLAGVHGGRERPDGGALHCAGHQ